MKPPNPNSNFIDTHPAIDPTPYPGTASETNPFPPFQEPFPGKETPPEDPPLPDESDPRLPQPPPDQMLQRMQLQLESVEDEYSLLQKYSFRTLWR